MVSLARCFNIADLREAARHRLPKGLFEFIDRGSEDETALRENRAAFERLRLRTRFMVDLSKRDMGTELFGRRSELPIAIAPTGLAGMCWFEGEIALARAAAAAGIPFTTAMGSISSMESIMAKAGGRLWFQLYMWREEEHSYTMVKRARDLGYEALVVTIDSGLGRTREHNDRNGFTLPFRLNARSVRDIALRPRWLAAVVGRYIASGRMPHHANYPEQYRDFFRWRPGGGEPSRHEAMTWEHVKRLRELWPRTMIVKSTLTAEDARQAVESGADGVVVSNHGGRALDSAAAPIDMLPEVVDAVGRRATIILDSGIRRGSDIVKALALGADGVMIGRPGLYGVATAGEAGAAKAIAIFRNEFEKAMGYVGARTVDELGEWIFAETASENATPERSRPRLVP